ncbi:MAG TPA: hypothetical protein VHS96_01725, partial [Bacteroidia bacterium]|nr:hypothetical protein [Bacteroidia bacterium]
EIPIPDGVSFTNAQDFLISMAESIRLLTTGGLYKAGVSFEIDLSASNPGLGFAGWGPVATLASDVQERAEFVFQTANGFLKRLNLPTIDESIFVPNSSVVDTSDPDVAAFVTAMEDGITVNATLIQPVDLRGEDITTLVSATENWGKARR